RNPAILWAGTDDGNLWITRDGGQKWTNVADKVGLPGPRWVATIEASRFADGRAYVVFDAHRSDDDNPWVYMTDDYGQPWTPIRGGLPMGSTRCLREDVANENLLYLGTEFSIYASIDRGKSWTKINSNLPTVAVHEIAVHPTAGEIVAATHGRSLWILDVAALRQMKPEALEAAVHLFKPHTATRYRTLPSMGRTNRRFIGANPPATGLPIVYSLTAKPERVSLKVVDISGKTLREFKAPATTGLHKVAWDLTQGPTVPGGGKKGGMGMGGGGKKGGGGPGAPGAVRALVPQGEYRVVLTVDEKEYSQVFRVEVVPALEAGVAGEEEWLEVREDD